MRTSQVPTVRRGRTVRGDDPTVRANDAPGRTNDADAATVRADAATVRADAATRTQRPRQHNNRAALPTPAQLVLERYRLHRRLGTGAFGTVWAARDERLDRDVAIKIIPRERVNPGRFEREARAAARLSHPAIVTLYEATIDDLDAFLVSELVQGATLDELLDEGLLSDRDIVAIAIALCDALGHAHAQGVVHRDVKPSNILIPERPATRAHPAKLTDFGVARLVGGDALALTHTGEILGTEAYMAPEQAEGREASAAADLYSIALVTYEALTGINPVRTGTVATRARRLGAHLPPLRRQRRDLPPELGRAIDLALRPRPRERGRIEELHDQLTGSLEMLGDTPGVVEGGFTLRRSLREGSRPEAQDGPLEAEEAGAQTDPTGPPWPQRALAAACAAVAVAWLGADALTPSALAPALAAMIAALLVLAMPRAGWLMAVAALAIAAAASHHPGVALILALAAPIPAVLLPRRGADWPTSAVAPSLGLIGLAGAWPALAARLGRSAPRRAVLGFTGWIWLALVGPLAGHSLYTRLPPETPATHQWNPSLNLTLHQVLIPLGRSGAFTAAPVWALAAVTLPWLVRGRWLAVDVIFAVTWSATTLAATEAAIRITHPPGGGATISTGAVGAVAAACVALAPGILRAWRERPQSRGSPAELA